MMDERASGSQAGISSCLGVHLLSLSPPSFFPSSSLCRSSSPCIYHSLVTTAAAVVSCLVLPKPREQLYIAGRPERE